MNCGIHVCPMARRACLFVLVFGVAMAQAQSPGLIVKNAWARPTLPPVKNTAAYMLLENPTSKPISVVSVSTSAASKAELHEMTMTNNMMKMAPLKSITVPPHGSVGLKPGGYHIMCIGLKKPLKAGDQIDLALKLGDGSSVPVTAPVRADAGPGQAEDGMQMQMH